jgi:hypothetical protein
MDSPLHHLDRHVHFHQEAAQKFPHQPLRNPCCEDLSSTTATNDNSAMMPPRTLDKHTPPKPHHRRRRRVHWGSKVTVKQIPHINDVPIDVIQNMWYSRGEYKGIKQRFAQTVRLIMNGAVLSSTNDENCTRGLEPRTRQGARARVEMRRKAVTAVLEAQAEQTSGEIGPDEEAVAKAYQQAGAEACQQQAEMYGKQDEQDIQEYLRGGEEHTENLELSSSSSSMEDVILEDVALGDEDKSQISIFAERATGRIHTAQHQPLMMCV